MLRRVCSMQASLRQQSGWQGVLRASQTGDYLLSAQTGTASQASAPQARRPEDTQRPPEPADLELYFKHGASFVYHWGWQRGLMHGLQAFHLYCYWQGLMPTSFALGHLLVFGLSFAHRIDFMRVTGESCITRIVLHADRRFVTLMCVRVFPRPCMFEISCRVANVQLLVDSNQQRWPRVRDVLSWMRLMQPRHRPTRKLPFMMQDVKLSGGVLVRVVDIDNTEHTLVLRKFDQSLLRGFDQTDHASLDQAGAADQNAEHKLGLLRAVMHGREDVVLRTTEV